MERKCYQTGFQSLPIKYLIVATKWILESSANMIINNCRKSNKIQNKIQGHCLKL